MLSSIPSDYDIGKATQDLKPDSAPGPDAFTGRDCWSLIREDFLAAIRDWCSFTQGLYFDLHMTRSKKE